MSLAPYPSRMARPVTKPDRFEFRLSPAMKTILDSLSEADGLPRAYVIELALRHYADSRGVDYPGKEKRTVTDPTDQPPTDQKSS